MRRKKMCFSGGAQAHWPLRGRKTAAKWPANAAWPANAQLHAIRCPGVLTSGCAVLYLDKREEPPIFREATVVAVDRTLTPPAYTVRIGESERETERSRLFVNRPADDQATVVQTTAA